MDLYGCYLHGDIFLDHLNAITIPFNTQSTAKSNCSAQYASHYKVILMAVVSVSPYSA